MKKIYYVGVYAAGKENEGGPIIDHLKAYETCTEAYRALETFNFDEYLRTVQGHELLSRNFHDENGCAWIDFSFVEITINGTKEEQRNEISEKVVMFYIPVAE